MDLAIEKMTNYSIINFPVIDAAELGSAVGGNLISSGEEYYRWLDQGLNSLSSSQEQPCPEQLLQTAHFVLPTGGLAGGTLLFQAPNQAPVTAFEYRIALPGQPVGSWVTCTSFEIQIPNMDLPAGSIAIRTKAANGLMPSQPVANRTAVVRYNLQVEVLAINGIPVAGNEQSYQARNKIMQWTIRVKSLSFIRMVHSNGLYGFQSIPAGESVFIQDVSNLVGQRRLWLAVQSNPEYVTPKYIVNLEA